MEALRVNRGRRVSRSALAILALIFTSRCATGVRSDRPAQSTKNHPADEQFERVEVRPSFAASSQSLGTLNVPIESSLGDWREIGPRNYGGKVFDLAVDPTNAGGVYAAYGAQGGLRKTTDGGNTWARVNDSSRNNSFASVAISPTNANVIFAGLSGVDLPDADRGILKSSDGGQTWAPIGPSDGAASGFYRIIVDRTDASVIYTATENRVYKTTNGGSSWSAILTYTGSSGNYNDLPDLVADPTNHNALLLAQKSIGILRTGDGGATWTSVDPAPANPAATVVAFAPSNPTIVYAERESGPPGKAMQTYRSVNGGQTWTAGALVANVPYEHQGRYDEAIVVDPADANHVFTANSYMSESKDGAATFTPVVGQPHPDHLRLVYAPSDPRTIFSGNDGGVWRSTDGGVTWSRFDQGVETNISFGIDVDPVSGVIYMSPGDYGCTRYTGNSDKWEAFHGAEWTDFFISPYNRNIIFSGLGTIQRTSDGGATWTNADPEPSGGRPYRYPFAYHPTDSQTVYASTKKLYKSTDLGNTWTVISPAVFDSLPSYIDWFVVASKNPSIIYALSSGRLWQTTDGGSTWSQRNTTGASGETTLAIVPSAPDQVYLGGYGGIQLCTNEGATCSDRSANLGSVRVRDIVIDPTNESRIFLGTDEGVFVTQNAAVSWSRLGTHLPPIRAWDLALLPHHLYASSGQGVWEFSRTTTTTPAIASFSASTTNIAPFAATTLSWNSYNAAASFAGIGSVPSFGLLTVHPDSSTMYTLTVGTGPNEAQQSVGVNVDQSRSLLATMLPRDFAAVGQWKYEELFATGGTAPLVYDSSATNGPAYFVSSGYGYVQYDTASNIIAMHPQGPTDRQMSATFTPSVAGVYRLAGAFARFNVYVDAGDGVIVSIIKNTNTAQPLFQTMIGSGYSTDVTDVFNPSQPSPKWFDVTVTLAAGDVVRFLVSAGPAGSRDFDATAFKVAVYTCTGTAAIPVITAPAGTAAGTTGVKASVVPHVGSSWSWTIQNGTITAGQGTSQITFTAGAAGTPLTLSVTETNASGCVSAPGNATVTVNVTITPADSGGLFVPIVLSSSGLGGAFFTSELGLTNRGSTDASISYAYTAAFGDSSGTAADSLQAGRQKILPDAITFLKGLGIPLGDSGNRGGTLRITFSGLSSADAGAATVRTTTSVAEGRAGLAYAGLPSLRLLSAPVYLCGLRQNATDRSNVAIMNAGGPADGDVTLRLTVVSGDPANPRTQALPDVPLSPGGFNQVSGILASNGLTLTNGYVKVERISGTAPFYAYGVVNDQANSDGSFVEPVVASPATAVTGTTLPVVVETSTFSTELVVTNFSASARTLTCTYVASALPGGQVAFNLALLPNEQQILPAFVQVLRSRGLISGGPGATFAGALFATDATGDLRGISIGARTSAAGGGGRYGLFYSVVANGAEATTSAWLYGLQQSADNRTNLALVNVGSADSSTDVFRIDLYDGATGQKTATVDNVSVSAKGFFQINTILAQYAPGVTSGYAFVTRTSGSNPFIAYAVVNDGGQPGQRSGDGAFVSASLPVGP